MNSNQYYRGINNRFDRRAAFLARHGFKYTTSPIPMQQAQFKGQGIAYFHRAKFPKYPIIPASAVMFADKRAWIDILKRSLVTA